MKLKKKCLKKNKYCVKDPWHFMINYVYTRERAGKTVKYPDYTYLKEFTKSLNSERLIVVLKSRQMLISWTVIAFIIWDCLFGNSSDTLVISKREEEARDLLYRAKFIHSHLPDDIRPKAGINNKNVLEFPKRNSRIISLPSSPDIGRSYSPSRVFWDEMAFTPHDEEVFQSLQPSLDGGGSFIGVSSPNGINTLHGKLCTDYKVFGFKRIDIHYSRHPQKDENWVKEAKRGISEERWNQEQELSLETAGRRVYERFNEKDHIADLYYSSELPVYRAIDFGYHTPVILWIQVTPMDEVIVFREWVGENNTISELLENMKKSDGEIGITEDDITITYCDPAGKAASDTGISSVDFLENNGIKIEYRQSTVSAGIDLVREKLIDASGKVFLKVSRNCRRVINDFRNYSKKQHSEEPNKDNVTDHTMDALRYFMVNYFDRIGDEVKMEVPARVAGVGRSQDLF